MPTEAIRWVQRELPQRTQVLEDLGVQSCRHKRGENAPEDEWSEHAWGNAWDLKIPPSDVAHVVAWLESQSTVAHVLTYGGGQLHISGSPLRNPDGQKVPPCAGGAESDTPTAQPALDLPGPEDAAAALAGPLIDRLAALLGANSVGALARRVGLAVVGVLAVVVGAFMLAGDTLSGATRRVTPGGQG